MPWLNRLQLRLPRRRGVPAATSIFADTLQSGAIWEQRRRSARRYAIIGAIVGALIGLVIAAPASWLAAAISQATGDRLRLAEARGTVWQGSAIVVLTGGEGSRDAATLPGRLEWSLRPAGLGLRVTARHACCLFGPTTVRLEPGIGRHAVVLPATPTGMGQWPAATLSGLGTPWNTLHLGGALRLSTPGARIELLQGRWRLDGQLVLDLNGISSRVSTLDELGSYRILVSGQRGGSENATLQVMTVGGALQVTGQGQWIGANLRFRGEASAAEGSEAALNNLLNIIGRRQGARSIITIG